MNWTTTPPTESRWFLWRRRGDHMMNAHLVGLGEPWDDGKLRVMTETVKAGAPKLFATARSLRGEWFGPVPQ